MFLCHVTDCHGAFRLAAEAPLVKKTTTSIDARLCSEMRPYFLLNALEGGGGAFLGMTEFSGSPV